MSTATAPKIRGISDFLALLDGVKPSGQGNFLALCPGHDDQKQSLSVKESGGKIILNCFAGCSLDRILSPLDLEAKDLFFDDKSDSTKPVITATYDYKDESGKLLFQVVRYQPKGFKQRRPDGKGGWSWNLDGTRRVLYRLPDILKAGDQKIYLVEGEKDSDNLLKCGRLATTSPGGAGNWRLEYADFLKGRNVVIIPDKDTAGYEYACKAANSLKGKTASLKAVLLPGDDKDISDWLSQGNNIEHLDALERDVAVLQDQPQVNPAATQSDSTEITKPEEFHDLRRHEYKWPLLGIRIVVDRLEDEGQAEIWVYNEIGDKPKLLNMSRTNLLSAQSCSQLAKRLESKLKVDWGDILTYVSTLTIQQHRQGEPVVEIGKQPADMKVRYRLEPLLEKGQATTIYAAGGSGKSYLADYFAVLIQLGYTGLNSDNFSLIPEQANVLYLDWEACQEDHQRRTWAIKQGLGIYTEETFYYRFCEQPLANDIYGIQKLIDEKDIGFVIVDSQMAASGYGPDAALQASQFYNALRSLRCTSLTIDHVSKSDWSGGSTESTGPYGSVVKYNRARSVFELKKSQEPDDNFLEMSLKHIKHNEGKLLKPIGIRINFNHGEGGILESVVFTNCNLTDNPALSKVLPLKDRLINALRRGIKDIDELSEELDTDKGTIRARLNGNKAIFKHFKDGWGLLR